MKSIFKRSVSLVLAVCTGLSFSRSYGEIGSVATGETLQNEYMAQPVLMDFLDHLTPYSFFEFTIDGQIWSGRYLGKDCTSFPCHYAGDHMKIARQVDPKVTTETLGTGDGSSLKLTKNSTGLEGRSDGSSNATHSSKMQQANSGEGDGTSANANSEGSSNNDQLTGVDLGSAVGAGLQSGLISVGVQELNRIIIFSPARESALRDAQDHYQQSSAELTVAENAFSRTHERLVSIAVQTAKDLQLAANNAVTAIDYEAPSFGDDGIPASWQSNSTEFRAKAEPILNTLLHAGRSSRLEDSAQEIGLHAVDAASKADLAGQHETAETLLSVAKVMADVLIGLNPYTGFARDTWEFFTGRNIVTGEALPTWQRALSGVGMAASLVTFGAASSVSNALKTGLRIVEEGKAAQRVSGIVAVSKAAKYVSRFKKAGFDSATKLRKLLDFSRSSLKNEIESAEGIAEFSNHWSDAAKKSFSGVAHDLRLSPEELVAEAKRLGVSPEVLAQRRGLAIGQYNNMDGFTGNSKRIAEHIAGIDMSKPVEMITVSKGETVYQWMRPDQKVGNYFSRTVEAPTKLGMNPRVSTEIESVTVERQLVKFTVEADVTALKSTSAGILDKFSVRNIPVQTEGGAIQLLVSPVQLTSIKGPL